MFWCMLLFGTSTNHILIDFWIISTNHILIDYWIICLIHCLKQTKGKGHRYCTLLSKNFVNSRLQWKLILLDGYSNLTFLSTKLLISWKTRLKSAVMILTAVISLFCWINKLGQWNSIYQMSNFSSLIGLEVARLIMSG